MAAQKDHKVGIYVRLSNEDSRAGESVSVENQKLMLCKHVKEMGWELKEIYIDDGFSGTNQNRPAFKRMIADVKQGFINTILIKDLSRLGRNYLEVGELSEVTLPQYGCELISLTEKLDEMAVFRNWFNEQHSKSTSKKVKAAKRICAENGKFLGTYAPYGYRKSAEDKHKLVIDEVTAPVVRRIFEMRAGGTSARAIALKLNDEGVTPPKEHYYQHKNKKNPVKSTGLWNDGTVKQILRSEVYIGNLVNFKSGTMSYKNHKQVRRPEEEWITVEGTHEPIVSREVWDRVQSFSQKGYKPRQCKDGGTLLFTGLLQCADCGYKLRGQVERKDRPDGSEYRRNYYTCGNYARSGKSACTIHSIPETALIDLVSEHIRKHARLTARNEDRIIEAILTMQNSESTSYRTAYQGEIAAHKKQLAKLDLLIESLYEDRVTGVVPESVFKNLIQKYEQDRVDRLKSVETLEKRIRNIKHSTDNAATWARLIKQHAELEVLDSETLLTLIDKIIVGESEVIGGVRQREVKIEYRYVGDLDRLALDEVGDGEAVSDYVRQAV